MLAGTQLLITTDPGHLPSSYIHTHTHIHRESEGRQGGKERVRKGRKEGGRKGGREGGGVKEVFIKSLTKECK